jgi:hypothetical protein
MIATSGRAKRAAQTAVLVFVPMPHELFQVIMPDFVEKSNASSAGSGWFRYSFPV